MGNAEASTAQLRGVCSLRGAAWGSSPCVRLCLRRCIAFGMARVMHDAAVASILAHFALHLAPRMGGPAGVDAKVRPTAVGCIQGLGNEGWDCS